MDTLIQLITLGDISSGEFLHELYLWLCFYDLIVYPAVSKVHNVSNVQSVMPKMIVDRECTYQVKVWFSWQHIEDSCQANILQMQIIIEIKNWFK